MANAQAMQAIQHGGTNGSFVAHSSLSSYRWFARCVIRKTYWPGFVKQ
jgi:hypothetical protein